MEGHVPVNPHWVRTGDRQMSETTAEFLNYLRDQGVRVTVNGDRLACSAPKGALTPELKAKLLQRKGELLEFLQPKILFDSLLPTAVTIADRRKLPLSFGQQRLWFLNQFQDDHSPYNIVIGMELDGLLD